MDDARLRFPARLAGGVVLAVLLSFVTPGVAVAQSTAAGLTVGGAAAVPVLTDPTDQLESVIEDYDRVATLLSADQAKATALDKTIVALDKKVTAAQVQLKPVVRQAAEIGDVTSLRLLVDATTMAGMLDQVGMAEAFAHRQQELIGTYTKARTKDAAAKKSLSATIATLTARKADLAAKKRTILAQIAAQQKILNSIAPVDRDDPSPIKPAACPVTPASGAAVVAVRAACAQLGKPYVWAAAGPNTFDCSGLMVYAWAKAGKHLRHFTGFMWDDLTPIKASQLRPGDLVFFFPPTMHHVGMYIGDGWMVVAPHTGDVVRMQKINTLPIGGYRRP